MKRYLHAGVLAFHDPATCRTFVALDSDGVVVVRGIFEPGGDKAWLLRDLQTILEILDPTALDRPTLHLVQD